MSGKPHPLIGRYLVWDCPTREYWTLGRFKERINRWVFLVEQLRRSDGESACGGDFLIHLHYLAVDDDTPDAQTIPRAQIFDDWEAVQRYVAEMEGPPADKIVKLVKKP